MKEENETKRKVIKLIRGCSHLLPMTAYRFQWRLLFSVALVVSR